MWRPIRLRTLIRRFSRHHAEPAAKARASKNGSSFYEDEAFRLQGQTLMASNLAVAAETVPMDYDDGGEDRIVGIEMLDASKRAA
jgi:hypothetical protein